MTTPETANTTTESSHPAEEVTSDSTQELALVNKEFIALLESQAKTHNVRTGIDYFDDKLWYGVTVKGRCWFITSGGQMVDQKDLSKDLQVPNVTMEAPMSNDGIIRYLQGATVNGSQLLANLENLFRTHAKFQLDSTPSLLAHWVLGGYLYMAFPTYPYLWITSAEKQSGKTRVLELLASVSFRTKDTWVDPSQAVIYRSIDQLGQVVIIDEFERSRDDTRAAMLTILNAGFRRGAMVPRCNSNDLSIEYYNSYCPKVFAALKDVPDTLASRSIPFRMFPKKKQDGVQPFSSTRLEKELRSFRDHLAIWALNNARSCAELVVKPAELGVPDCLDDRAADYMAPLFSVAKVAKSDTRQLVEFCKSLSEFRESDLTETKAAQIVAVLRDVFPAGDKTMRLHLDKFVGLSSSAGLYADSKDVGKILRNLNITVKQMRIDQDNKKGLEVTRHQLDDLIERFHVPPEQG